MLTAVVLAAVLGGAPAQPAAGLKLTNVRLTVGELGPTRDGNKVLPGDVLFIAFDADGMTINDQGIARYTIELEVTNAAGMRILPDPKEPKPKPREQADFVPLRGNKMPLRAFITAGLDQPAGTYTCKINVADLAGKTSAELSVKFEVVKRDFGIVAVYTTNDGKGEVSAPTTGQVGQSLFVNFSIVTFERDAKFKQPDVEFAFQLYEGANALLVNAKNEPTPVKDYQDAKSPTPVKETDAAFAKQFPLFMNRPGKFVLEITATDRVSKKTAVYKLPVTVTGPN
ncbi:MAG: hypothetical protein FJ304_13595 [Planctomycetes bacterium]|nr:hypothetical protein [Planctomycetota bacterium]